MDLFQVDLKHLEKNRKGKMSRSESTWSSGHKPRPWKQNGCRSKRSGCHAKPRALFSSSVTWSLQSPHGSWELEGEGALCSLGCAFSVTLSSSLPSFPPMSSAPFPLPCPPLPAPPQRWVSMDSSLRGHCIICERRPPAAREQGRAAHGAPGVMRA